MHCHQCGRQIDASRSFCVYCGAKQMPNADDQAEPRDSDPKHERSPDAYTSLSMGEEMFFDLEEDEFGDDTELRFYGERKRPIRWFPVAASLLSVLFLIGVVIGIWFKFFSKKNEDVEFADPTYPTQPTYQMHYSPSTSSREQESTSTHPTESEKRTRETTPTPPITSTSSAESSKITMTTSPPSVEIVIVTDPSVTQTTPFPDESLETSSVEQFDPVTTSADIVPTSFTTPSPAEEEEVTTESRPCGFLSIDNVQMVKWPEVMLHFSYSPPQTTPANGSEDFPSSVTSSESKGPTAENESIEPPPFDIRYLSVLESETADGPWVEQTISEKKSVSKFVVIAETGRAMTEAVPIGEMRTSLSAFIETMVFGDDESVMDGDAFGLMQFSDSVKLLTAMTYNEQEALDSLNELSEGADKSLLWDSLYSALGEAEDHGAVILITRGEDTGSALNFIHVGTAARLRGISVYIVLIKTEESDPPGVKEERFRSFSELTGGCCYVIDATEPETDIAASLTVALKAAYGGDQQNRFIYYRSTTNIEAVNRFVKIIYAQEGQESIESDVVSYSIPQDADS